MTTSANSAALTALVDAAEKINAFARPFTLSGCRTDPKKLTLASVWALVMDDKGGPLDANVAPVGEIRLLVEVEFFKENARSYSAAGRAAMAASEKAEDDVICFCKSLGFNVEFESNTGSGEHGKMNTLTLTPRRARSKPSANQPIQK